MTEEQMRQALIATYAGTRWKTKVTNMTDAQVVAIYMRLKLQGKVA